MADERVQAEVEEAARREAAPEAPGARTYLDIGRDMQAGRRDAHAVAAFERAVQLEPANLQARFALGSVLLSLHDLPRAISSFQACVDAGAAGLFIEMEDPYLHLGYCHEQSGRVEEAARWFRESLRVNPKGGDNALSLGGLLHRQGRFDDAVTAYRQGGAQCPSRKAEFEFYTGLASAKKPLVTYQPPGHQMTMRIDRLIDQIEDLEKGKGGQ